MNFWLKISSFIANVQAGGAQLLDRLQQAVSSAGELRRSVAFTVAMIALSAKMAKADGVVTFDEEAAFHELFDVPDKELANVVRLFNLAKQDVAGFEAYAQKMADLFADDEATKTDVLDGLFHIAKADGVMHSAELAFLERVAQIFGMDSVAFARLKARHVRSGGDPYLILGIDEGAGDDEIKAHYRREVRETHPDRLIARGIPEEFVRIANERLVAINEAYAQIRAERGL
ncbi:J domain-containing protein [Polycladidibacter hongkongensis]|uniref:J domain-containing protein n=1 Tax=Polycladidibacter hongkongensis TaxID=1647556 RepID=UPI00083462F8|nr:DnaJ family molecular chaperone [Pseudovibrio hongkongensis]